MIDTIRQYFITNNIIDSNSKINVDFLGKEPTEFSLEPLPTQPIIKRYINGKTLRQYQFQLISCNDYGADILQNIENSTFYDNLSLTIERLNNRKTFPNITGVKSIECLNNGTILNAETNTARYSIQMKIIYEKEKVE